MEVCVEESRCCIAEWRRGGRKLFPDGDWEVSMNYKRLGSSVSSFGTSMMVLCTFTEGERR